MFNWSVYILRLFIGINILQNDACNLFVWLISLLKRFWGEHPTQVTNHTVLYLRTATVIILILYHTETLLSKPLVPRSDLEQHVTSLASEIPVVIRHPVPVLARFSCRRLIRTSATQKRLGQNMSMQESRERWQHIPKRGTEWQRRLPVDKWGFNYKKRPLFSITFHPLHEGLIKV